MLARDEGASGDEIITGPWSIGA